MRRWWIAAGAALVLGCADARAGAPPPRVSLGLVVADELPVDWSAFGSPHLTQMVREGERIYLASSDDGLAVVRVGPDGLLAMVSQTRPPGSPPDLLLPGCTTIAIHAPTRSLFCATADRPGIARFSLDDPDLPALASTGARMGGARDLVRALVVRDGTLYAASFGDGLRAGAIGSDGTIDAFELALSGEIVGAAAWDDGLVVLDRARGLVVLRASPSGLEEIGAIALEGPMLDLEVHEGRAAVARGSLGATLVELAPDGPRETISIDARCVVTAVDFATDLVAVGCTSGIRLFDVRGAAPRLAGALAAHLTTTDLRFDGDRLRTLEWWSLRQLALDVDGVAAEAIAREGAYVASGADVTLLVENPSTIPLRFRMRPERGVGAALADVELAASSRTRLDLAASAVAVIDDSFGYRTISMLTDEGGLDAEPFTVVVRGSEGPPAIGEVFEPLVDATGAVPIAGAWTQIWFVYPTCALQWPELEDLAWRVRSGAWPASVRPVVVLVSDPAPGDRAAFLELWGAGGLEVHALADMLASVPDLPSPAPTTLDLFDARWLVRAIPGPDYTMQYLVDPDGIVRDHARIYRGAFDLAIAGPGGRTGP